ncbi:MAG: transporter substrate-binding domain-containing protein [Desulfobacterales bacterium]|nr:transporter substrate-binding domain-containing protein [Desulfobacterales bacterium]MBF0396200.1 transporter substrate-binding domain-containing protein [Desulfobacterales bacterium]
MRNTIKILIFMMAIYISLPSTVSAVVSENLSSTLTVEERDFLAKIGMVKVHNESDWAPFNFNENKSPKGFSIDYMKLLAEKVGLQIKFINGPSWDEFLDMTKKGTLDIMLNIAKSPERLKFLEFTPSYVSMIQMLYTRMEIPTVSSIKDLYGKRFAVPKGFFLQEILKAHPQIEIVGVSDTSSAIRAVSVGKADALFDLMPVVDYITNQLQITNLKVGGDLAIKEGKPIPLHIAVRKDIKILAGILEKGMTKITDEELRKLNEKWLINFDKTNKDFTHAKDPQVVLTEEERAFISGKQIRLGVDSARPPFEYINEKGVYSGISAEFIIAAAKKLGISIVPQKDMKWTEAMEKVKIGQIDVIPKVTPSAERKKHMIFTVPYTTFPSVIVSRKEHLAGGMDDLRGLKVGVIKGQIIEANLKRDRPELLLITSPDIKTALSELSTGKFDVFIDNLGTVAYAIDTFGLANLRIAASTPYNHDLAFGIRKDWPLLASALDKALASMTDQEKTEIKNRWLSIKYQKGIDWRILGPIVGACLSIIIFVLIWNRRLGRAIMEREHAERKIKAMGQSMADALVMINSQGNVMFWNQAAEKLFGYTEAEALGMDFHEISVPPEVRDKAHQGIREFAVSGKGPVLGCTGQYTAINRLGEKFPVEVTLSSFQVDNEWFAVGTVRDITDRKKAEEAIKESEKRFRGYFEYSQIGMAVTHPQKGWLEVNKRMQEMLGYNLEELHQTTWAGLTHPDDIEADSKNFERMLEGYCDYYSMDKRFIRKDGKILYTNLSISCLRDEQKSVSLVLASLLDITDRMHAKKELEESRAKLQYILDMSPVGVAFFTQGKIHFANPRFKEMFGVDIGDPYPNLYIDPNERDLLMEKIKSEGKVENYDVQMYNKLNEVRDILITYLPIKYDGEDGILGWMMDITERKQSEKQMKEQMEELQRFSVLTINREERMIQLKEEINLLMEQLGKGKKYKIVE